MVDNVLYIIGNGFDLHHGVASSYASFCKWLKKHDFELYDLYETVCSYDALWSDFETSMAYVIEIISWRQVRQCYQILNLILTIGQWLTIY